MRKILNKKELAEVKYQDTDEWIAKGNKIKVLQPHKPEVKVYFGYVKTKSKKGAMK